MTRNINNNSDALSSRPRSERSNNSNSSKRDSSKALYSIEDEGNSDVNEDDSFYILGDEEYDEYGVEDDSLRKTDEEEEDSEDEAAESDEAEDEAGEEDYDEEEAEKTPKTQSPFLLLAKMMLNPVTGWKEIRRANMSPEELSRRCFYPLLAIAAASCFIELIYDSSKTVSDCMVLAVSVFSSAFFGNFLIQIFAKASLPEKLKKLTETRYFKDYIIYCLSTLAIFFILFTALPMVSPVLVFLPIWTIYLAIRGARFFRFPKEKSNLLKTLFCLYIIGAPVAIFWIFDMILVW